MSDKGEGKTREEVLAEIEQTEATLEELQSELVAFNSTEDGDAGLEFATLKATVKGMSAKLDRLEVALAKIIASGSDGESAKPEKKKEEKKDEVTPPRKETVLDLDEDGAESAALLNDEGDLSVDPDDALLQELNKKQRTHAEKYGE